MQGYYNKKFQRRNPMLMMTKNLNSEYMNSQTIPSQML